MVTPAQFKEAMAEFASGVTVVTTGTAADPHGMTVSAFASVSLEPPLVLVSVARTATAHDVFASARAFAVHVLGDDQAALAWRFAGPSTMVDRFAGVPWAAPVGGPPRIDGCLAVIVCALEAAHVAGDHTLYLGRVLDAGTRAGGKPLLFHRRGLFEVGAPIDAR